MLKGLHPALNAEVLYVLKAMGHGDDLLLVDTNFPAHSMAKSTAFGRPLQLDCKTLAEATAAVLSLYPLDTFVDDAAGRMQMVDTPDVIPDVMKEVQVEIDKAEGRSFPMIAIERFAYYERAKKAYCIIQTGERRFYGNVALRKGVIPPDA